MKKLTKNDIEKYLSFGEATLPFLDNEALIQNLQEYARAKELDLNGAGLLYCLTKWINKNVRYTSDVDFSRNNKFSRTAREIWESEKATGCTDYAILFATLARQLNLPTTILHTAEKNWVDRYLNNGDYKIHYGHTFCECFCGNKWVLVDPTFREITVNYDPNLIKLEYEVAGNNAFISYMRAVDFARTDIKTFNLEMEQAIQKLHQSKSL